MYLLRVSHHWVCSQCGRFSPAHPTEPKLRKACLAEGWLEVLIMHESLATGPDVVMTRLLEADDYHYCPVHAKEHKYATSVRNNDQEQP